MNRIILIGNGFDLAHDLKTDYRSFIDHLWEDKLIKFQNDFNYVDEDIDIKGLNYYRNSLLPNLINSHDDFLKYNIDKTINNGRLTIVYKNVFLKKITEHTYLKNWVDVENEYFKMLLNITNKTNAIDSEIKKLNRNFSTIKKSLEKYITDEIRPKAKSLKRIDDIYTSIYSNFKVEDFSKFGFDFLYNEIKDELNLMIDISKVPSNFQEHVDIFEYVVSKDDIGKSYLNEENLKKLFQNHELAKHYLDFKPSNCLLLSFNYTHTESYYSTNERYNNFDRYRVDTNHIHGELNNTSNPIIFGYGDEIGKEYTIIEEANNNDLLENVKSIRYLDTDKYKKLLEYIASEKYQIFIMGHSCGNSDRTLLNTLFEHKNCVSIKVFYHQINEHKDNYSDVIRNISRNFNDKKMMREKVVNKEYCSPLVKK